MANAAFWDNIAEGYAAKPVENPEAFERKIVITKGLMRAEDVVLDIGCGTGSLALRLADSGGHLHGLDISKEMIRIARGKATDQQVGNVSFHVGPFDDTFTVFEPGSLDGICAYSLLHLVADRPGALRQIFELIKPGGFFVSSTVCLGNTWVPFGPILTVMRWMGKAPDIVRSVSTDTLVAEVKAAGFVDVQLPDVGAEKTVAFMVAKKPEVK
ncbi:MAG: class I SAM-dependent methyltransferase [Bradymonadia bacterium]